MSKLMCKIQAHSYTQKESESATKNFRCTKKRKKEEKKEWKKTKKERKEREQKIK